MQIVIVFKDHSAATDFADWLRSESYGGISKSNSTVRVTSGERVSISNIVGRARGLGGEVNMRD